MPSSTSTQTWTVRTTMILCFSAMVIVIVAMNVFTLSRLFSVRAQTESLTNDTQPGMYLIGKIEALAERDESLVDRYLQASDPVVRREHSSNWQANLSSLDQLTTSY